MRIFLIERLWTNSIENHPMAAYGYEPHGFMLSKSKAEKLSKSEMVPKSKCWALNKPMPKYRFKELGQIND